MQCQLRNFSSQSSQNLRTLLTKMQILMTQCFEVIRYSSVQNVVFQILVFILG